MIRRGKDAVHDEGLGTIRNRDVVCVIVQATAARQVTRDGGSELRNPGRRGVPVLAGIERPFGCFANIGGGWKVGLTNRKADDVAAVGDELVDLGQHHECVLGAEGRCAL